MALSSVVLIGGTEWTLRTFFPHRVRTYFDDQTEAALGQPVPKKASGEYRIFIFGGSAAYGFPLADRYSITAWLRKSYPYLLPEKEIRVINAAWPGKGSHYVLEGALNVLKYDPDLFIIYSGYNDFPIANRIYLDNWLYRVNLRLKFRSASYLWLSKRINKLRKKIVYGSSGYPEKHYRDEVIANKVYQKIEVDDAYYQRILDRYQQNMEKVIHQSKRWGIDVLFVSLPANLRDIPPNFSSHRPDLPAAELADWEKSYALGLELAKKGNHQSAIKFYEQAAAIDNRYAELAYQRGLSLEEVGQYDEARRALKLARDLDERPWRGKSSLNRLIRELTEKHGLIFVNLMKVFEQLSIHGIIGSDLIYDNVHPSEMAQLLIADVINLTLAEQGKIAPSEKWQWRVLESTREDEESEEWKIEGSVKAYHYISRGIHLWEQGRYDEVVVDLEKGVELMPDFLELYGFLGDVYWHLGRKKDAVEAFQTFEDRDPLALETTLRKYPDIQQSYAQSAQHSLHTGAL